MSEDNGYNLIRKVRARDAERGGRILALALTAYARIEDRAAAISAGCQQDAAEPIEPGERGGRRKPVWPGTEAGYGRMRKTGLRLLGDLPWGRHVGFFYQRKRDLMEHWVDFFDYEERLNRYLSDKAMLVMCAYPSAAPRAAAVARTHSSTMRKRRGEWGMQ